MNTMPKMSMAGLLLASAGLAASPSGAELTAEELLLEIQRAAESAGAVLSWESREETRDGIMLGDVSQTVIVRGEEMQHLAELAILAEWVRLTETGDGSVSITFPATMQFNLDVTGDTRLSGTVTQSGTEILAGMDGGLTVRWRSDRIVSEGFIGSESGEVYAVLQSEYEGVNGTSTYSPGGEEPAAIAMDILADRLSLGVSTADSSGTMAIRIENLAAMLDTELRESIPDDEVLPYGRGEFTAGYDSSVMRTRVGDDEASVTAVLETGAGHYAGRLDPGSSSSGFSVDDIDVSVESMRTDFDFGLAFRIGEWNASIEETELEDSDKVRTDLRLEMAGLDLGPELLALIDPGGVLPATPGRLNADLSLITPSQWRTAARGPAGASGPEEGSLDLVFNVHQAEFLGATLTADGELSYEISGESSDEETIPIGAATAELGGLELLADTIYGAGWMRDDVYFLVQLVIGVGQKNTDGNSVYDIEFLGPDGIKVNGLNF